MSRPPTVWFRKHDGWYYTTIRGEKIKLARNKKDAERAFHALLSRPEEEEGDGLPKQTPLLSFRKLADLYLEHCKQNKDEKTYQLQRHFLQSLSDFVRGRKAMDLRPRHVSEWLVTKKTWQHNSRVTARGILRSCLNWAVEEGYLVKDPMPSLKVGQMHGRERILTAEEKAGIRGAIRDQTFRDFILFLEQTGARPYSEASSVTAEMIDWEAGSIPLAKHKNARKGKRRVIYLTPDVTDMLRRRVELHPTGPLFLTKRGIPFNNRNTNGRLRRLEKKLNIPRFNLYAYRHSYITDALGKGLTADVVAELVGNSARTISKYYAHLEQRQDVLREAARRAIG
jgi:integrase